MKHACMKFGRTRNKGEKTQEKTLFISFIIKLEEIHSYSFFGVFSTCRAILQLAMVLNSATELFDLLSARSCMHLHGGDAFERLLDFLGISLGRIKALHRNHMRQTQFQPD